MNRILRFITQVYGRLIKLFPPKFQDEFGEEMQVVFSEVVTGASRRGKLAFAVACSQELIDFPILLVRSHLEEKLMLKTFRSQPVRFAFRGAVGFSLGFAFLRVFSLISVYWLSTNFGDQMSTGWLHVLAVFAGCGLAALAGGLIFALLLSERTQFSWYALVGTLGLFIPQATLYVLMMADYRYMNTNQMSVLPIAGNVLVGAFLGLMLCVARSKQRVFRLPLIVAAVMIPILFYIILQSLLPGNHSSSVLFVAELILVALLVAGAIFLSVKSDRSGLWLVIAGMIGYPIIFHLFPSVIYYSCQIMTTSTTGGYLLKSCPIEYIYDSINTGLPTILDGIVLGLLLGLIFGWQKRSTTLTA